MKKISYFIPILLVAPILSSCKGMLISTNQARVIIENIKQKFNENNYEKFTVSLNEKDGENSSLITKIIYDKNAKYYHSYEITNTQIAEYWSYAKNSANGEYHFYDCVRYNGAVDEHGYPAVNVKETVFSDDQWLAVETKVNKKINSFLTYSLETIETLFKKENEVSLTLSSMNDYSLCVEAKHDDNSMNFVIDNSMVTSYSTSTGKDCYANFNCDYSKASIIYLNI